MALSRLRSRLHLEPLQAHQTTLESPGDGCLQHAADHVDTLYHSPSQFQQESSFNTHSNYLIRPGAAQARAPPLFLRLQDVKKAPNLMVYLETEPIIAVGALLAQRLYG